MAETLNMIEAPLNEIQKFIKDMIDFGIYDPCILIGKMGMGKTATIKGLAQKLGIGYCEIRLVNMTETDMLGIPTISENGTTTYASNDLLPIVERDGEVGILAIDEITSCSATMRAAAYQLLDGQRKLGNYKLPDKWMPIGLGNGPDDGGVFNGAEAALFNRCYCFRVAESIDAWKPWAIENGIHPVVVAYLSYAPDKLHKFDPDEIEGVNPSPRTWEKLSKILLKYEEANGNRPLDMGKANFLASSCIGVRDAAGFSGFYNYTSNNRAIDVISILEGEAPEASAQLDPQVVYIAIESLIRELGKRFKTDKQQTAGQISDDMIRQIDNTIKWLISLKNVRLDYAIMGIQDVVSGIEGLAALLYSDSRFSQSTALLEFAQENVVVVM